jgi:DNA-binding transcriptional MerR regulator
MDGVSLKVGELARRSGVSVRTLHHYEELKLLCPTARTPTGHRLYAAKDVARLQQIVSLRSIGLSLAEIRDVLSRRSPDAAAIVSGHIEHIRQQIALQQHLCDRLERVAWTLRRSQTPSSDDLLRAIEVTMMLDKYTPEQRALFEERAREVGQERIREVEAEWPVLIAEVRAEMQAGTAPSSERVQTLATRWQELVREFTGGKPEIEKLAQSAVVPQFPKRDPAGGIDQEMMAYITEAQRSG